MTFPASLGGDNVAQYLQPGNLGENIWAVIQPAHNIIHLQFVHVDI